MIYYKACFRDLDFGDYKVSYPIHEICITIFNVIYKQDIETRLTGLNRKMKFILNAKGQKPLI